MKVLSLLTAMAIFLGLGHTGLRAGDEDMLLDGYYVIEFKKDAGWVFVYEIKGDSAVRKFAKLPGAALKRIGGKGTVKREAEGTYLLGFDGGVQELWTPDPKEKAYKVQRGQKDTVRTDRSLKGTAMRIE